MTLYYTLVFALLMFEMALFMFLIVPLPHNARRTILTFISENKTVGQIQHGLKITFIFILVLFIDSVNRVYRVQMELSDTMEKAARSGGTVVLGHERTEVQARKFYAQRNMYLCGFTLFLSLILNRTYAMIKDIVRLEERLRAYDGDKSSSAKASSTEVAALKKQLELKEQDLQTLKKQSEQLHKSYNDLSDQYDANQVKESKKEK
ncbi:B-cell receptor-associated 31-like protein [Cordyceps fumosorosea ARSEF 2679]|uniref:Endoplasmic reticulum transmembrane protein n=1 Tax=Cordyceps fumosorosea (strain ARSEF 2679) TaxID=1081104 RepID=A0A162KDW0_CORFA|nr:B-cell receptor-associated 31-like protein [Cordyceps fumosorosea ARSEF 2679]OAA49684.1 B-cell receptor-associated 31-like protein [Cordyceps fumosorosea ARSEF 2679]